MIFVLILSHKPCSKRLLAHAKKAFIILNLKELNARTKMAWFLYIIIIMRCPSGERLRILEGWPPELRSWSLVLWFRWWSPWVGELGPGPNDACLSEIKKINKIVKEFVCLGDNISHSGFLSVIKNYYLLRNI